MEYISKKDEIKKGKTPIVFLHGFTGSLSDWNFLTNKLPERFTPVSIDILGHGKSSSPENPQNYSEENLVEHLHYILKSIGIKKYLLVGYSMGGRLALCYTLSHPGNVNGLFLESTTAGIEDNELKIERIRNDKLLANKLLTEGIEKFINYWFSIPLFNSFQNFPSEKFKTIN